MTDHAATLPRRVRQRGEPDRITVTLLTLAGFLAVFAVLATRLSAAAPAAAPAPRIVVLRRIYRTTIVHRGSSQQGRGASATVSVSTSATASPAAPTTRTSSHP